MVPSSPLDDQRVCNCHLCLFSLQTRHLQCFSLRITLYGVFPRSMSLSQKNEWLSLTEKKQNGYNFERTRVSSQQLLGVCVCSTCMSLSPWVTVSESVAILFFKWSPWWWNVQNGPKITTSSSWNNCPKLVIVLSTQQSALCCSSLCVCCVVHIYVTQSMSHSELV